jgi:quercetin dioxygenase-like cupin family protein
LGAGDPRTALNERASHVRAWPDVQEERPMKSLYSAAVLLVLATPPSAQADAVQAESVKVTPLHSTETTASGQLIVLPRGDIQVITSTYEIAPGAKLPEHKHPYPRYGYVLSGKLRITNTDTGKSVDYGPGDFIIESPAQWHKAENIGAEPVKLLVIDQVKPGQNNTILRQQNTATVGHH